MNHSQLKSEIRIYNQKLESEIRIWNQKLKIRVWQAISENYWAVYSFMKMIIDELNEFQLKIANWPKWTDIFIF